jgi:hypothetical protein
MQAHHAAWATVTCRGDLIGAREHVRQGLRLYDRKEHRTHALLYGGHDPAVCGNGHGAIALWMLGYPDQAVDSVRRGIDLANELAHVPSIGIRSGGPAPSIRCDRTRPPLSTSASAWPHWAASTG